ncbi:SP_1767 family glycosyltransferase [Turicibacter sanguinis]|uniref:SP_1767 family glycosyltransferase n=1 Tax=Turicibacter sanguinis TaxID=154288 RepID=UPI00232EA1FC|nr:SP_1767 family glycosyltransferase [Turicibacter sanguinis]MDB8540866.1 SP_1767 family glycosyltransferase [Turicibacter sanguinis]
MKKNILKIYYEILTWNDNIKKFYNRNIISKKKPPFVYGTDETLNRLVQKNISISRFGDGEFALIYKENLKFQKYDKNLAKRLKAILKSDSDSHLVCIPDVFQDLNIYTLESKKYWTKYLELNRWKIYRILKKNKEYYNTQVTRLYIDIKEKKLTENHFNKIKQLWNNREILIVEGEQSRLGVGNDLFSNSTSIERIICPSLNAYSKYSQILEQVKKTDKNKLVLIALGPTATVLSYDLHCLGYQAVDIGHIDIEYEWFLSNATEKHPIKHKYIGEIPGGDIVLDLNSATYESQIICYI